MANFYENNVAETKATFAETISKKNNKPKGPVSVQAKYEVSKNALKNGFSSKRFIIYGENKKEYEQYRDGLLGELKPINPNSRNGVYNLETKQTLENSFNIENIYNKSNKDIKKYLNHHNKNSEVFGLIFARDCAGSQVIEHITELEQKMMARYHKILNQYLADRFGKETINE